MDQVVKKLKYSRKEEGLAWFEGSDLARTYPQFTCCVCNQLLLTDWCAGSTFYITIDNNYNRLFWVSEYQKHLYVLCPKKSCIELFEMCPLLYVE